MITKQQRKYILKQTICQKKIKPNRFVLYADLIVIPRITSAKHTISRSDANPDLR